MITSLALFWLAACEEEQKTVEPAVVEPTPAVVANTCTGTFPSYWQDPNPKFAEQWLGQKISDTPDSQNWNPQNPAYTNAPFQLSDAFPQAPVDDAKDQPWRDDRFKAMFDPATPADQRQKLGEEYAWLIMNYIQEGNTGSGKIDTDWTMCENKVRPWFHIPFQTYEVLGGREFVHGLTREAPVTFSLKNVKNDQGGDTLNTVVWAVAFYNANAAYTLGTVWRPDGTAKIPTSNVAFNEGAVVGKLLFNTATPDQFPNLKNLPTWTANMSGFENGKPVSSPFCKPATGSTMPQQSEACPRSIGQVTLLQFDISVRDSRSPSGWVYGTFVADGEFKAGEADPWKRISPLGLMWGNDAPPAGGSAFNYPADPRANGFAAEIIFWDVVDRLNAAGGAVGTQQPGHMGCDLRLNGPADNINSSCLSCHMTGSVPDKNNVTPPLLSTFGGLTPQCVDPSTKEDRSGATAKVVDGVTYQQMDSIYFADTRCATPVNMTVDGKNVLGTAPDYGNGSQTWISTDFSMQLSISLVQWQELQADLAAEKAAAEAANSGPETLGEAPSAERVFQGPMMTRGR